MPARDYEVVVLGGGAAGLGAARSAVTAGARTLLVTEGPPGGDCTFTGCVPSKTLVEAADRILPGHDPDASMILTDVLSAEGVAVHVGAQVTAAEQHGGEVLLRTSGETISGQRLLVAVGRTPATRDLGVDAAGVDVDDRGFVVVDEHLATSASGVFAAGDVTGLFGHTHAAYAMGRVATGSALRRWRRPTFRTDAVPQVVFTDPEIATIGVQEHESTERRARIAYLPMSEVDRAITADATIGFLRLIAGPRRVLGNTGGGRLLGATVVAPRAGELINELALAATTGMFTGRLAQTVHAYPTWSLAIQQAAAQFFGTHGGRTARSAKTPTSR